MFDRYFDVSSYTLPRCTIQHISIRSVNHSTINMLCPSLTLSFSLQLYPTPEDPPPLPHVGTVRRDTRSTFLPVFSRDLRIPSPTPPLPDPTRPHLYTPLPTLLTFLLDLPPDPRNLLSVPLLAENFTFFVLY